MVLHTFLDVWKVESGTETLLYNIFRETVALVHVLLLYSCVRVNLFQAVLPVYFFVLVLC